MAWEWSHTNEAYANAEANARELPRAELLTILREWAHRDRVDGDILRVRLGAKRPGGFRLPVGIRQLATADLADRVWERAEQLRTCTTGGHDAYLCPYGCHTVPFDRDDDADAGATAGRLPYAGAGMMKPAPGFMRIGPSARSD